ncbi:uncharacterized protein PAN0_006c3048 [Moesziomyces antarcticus]|uniref:Uncharacterized protein n=2 Tax=Pseudozyma antarctica TaxID=84753 RepID=A0A5C3FNL8_PSEA2|nr:uncharacterized protein PAN0_006c3048 [Moesziomyces antarcticus]GAK64833.1 hypothetical protein PAN0_006c3048 [Moesziomyces antarcticus]SPO45826.1 uncharacterized protein PSANT_03512 [Moesziomyces antarcticus]
MSNDTRVLTLSEAMTLCDEARAYLGLDSRASDMTGEEFRCLELAAELVRAGVDGEERIRRMAKVLEALLVIRGATDPSVPDTQASTTAVVPAVSHHASSPPSPSAHAKLEDSITTYNTTPQDPQPSLHHRHSIRLGNSSVYSDEFMPPSLLRRVAAGRGGQSTPLNIVARILRNMATPKISTSAFRFMTIDIGDGRETKVKIMRDTDLYHEYGDESPFAKGTVVVLRKILGAFTEKGICLKFNADSSATRLVSASWQDTIEWLQAIDGTSSLDE